MSKYMLQVTQITAQGLQRLIIFEILRVVFPWAQGTDFEDKVRGVHKESFGTQFRHCWYHIYSIQKLKHQQTRKTIYNLNAVKQAVHLCILHPDHLN